MKTEYWILLGIGAYWLYSRSSSAFVHPTPFSYPPNPTGSRSTGSGGTTASGGGMGTSVTNPPVGGAPGNPSWSPNPTGVNTPADPGYVQCLDGSYATDPSQCIENQPVYYCADGTPTNDPMSCPENQANIPSTSTYDSGDPCDPTSMAYDPATCASYQGGGGSASDYGSTWTGVADAGWYA